MASESSSQADVQVCAYPECKKAISVGTRYPGPNGASASACQSCYQKHKRQEQKRPAALKLRTDGPARGSPSSELATPTSLAGCTIDSDENAVINAMRALLAKTNSAEKISEIISTLNTGLPAHQHVLPRTSEILYISVIRTEGFELRIPKGDVWVPAPSLLLCKVGFAGTSLGDRAKQQPSTYRNFTPILAVTRDANDPRPLRDKIEDEIRDWLGWRLTSCEIKGNKYGTECIVMTKKMQTTLDLLAARAVTTGSVLQYTPMDKSEGTASAMPIGFITTSELKSVIDLHPHFHHESFPGSSCDIAIVDTATSISTSFHLYTNASRSRMICSRCSKYTTAQHESIRDSML